jgi:hypothetical protein
MLATAITLPTLGLHFVLSQNPILATYLAALAVRKMFSLLLTAPVVINAMDAPTVLSVVGNFFFQHMPVGFSHRFFI